MKYNILIITSSTPGSWRNWFCRFNLKSSMHPRVKTWICGQCVISQQWAKSRCLPAKQTDEASILRQCPLAQRATCKCWKAHFLFTIRFQHDTVQPAETPAFTAWEAWTLAKSTPKSPCIGFWLCWAALSANMAISKAYALYCTWEFFRSLKDYFSTSMCSVYFSETVAPASASAKSKSRSIRHSQFPNRANITKKTFALKKIQKWPSKHLSESKRIYNTPQLIKTSSSSNIIQLRRHNTLNPACSYYALLWFTMLITLRRRTYPIAKNGAIWCNMLYLAASTCLALIVQNILVAQWDKWLSHQPFRKPPGFFLFFSSTIKRKWSRPLTNHERTNVLCGNKRSVHVSPPALLQTHLLSQRTDQITVGNHYLDMHVP